MLFTATKVGGTDVNNRVVMAPMTRSRSTQPGDIPNDLMAEYYAQRASAGLIITEGTPISAVARGYSMTPGIYTPEQVAGWTKVTKAVHNNGGKIAVQLWHVGRRSHASIAGETPVSASAVKNPDKVYGPLSAEGKGEGFGMIETDMPRAMTQTDIDATINDFVQAAKNAMHAGFDAVELHGAHGYLLDQFLRSNINQRDDKYGGSPENRIRFVVEIASAVSEAIGADKVGIRLSPHVVEGASEGDNDMLQTTLLLIQALDKLGLAFIHLSENISNAQPVEDDFRISVRELFAGKVIVAGKLDQQKAQALLDSGWVDLTAFGQPFITNPDLVERMQHSYPLTPVGYDAHSTFYGGGAEGYTDYPRYVAAD